jgi:hypothetical protein
MTPLVCHHGSLFSPTQLPSFVCLMSVKMNEPETVRPCMRVEHTSSIDYHLHDDGYVFADDRWDTVNVDERR